MYKILQYKDKKIRIHEDTGLFSWVDIAKVLGLANPVSSYHQQIREPYKGTIPKASYPEALGVSRTGLLSYLERARKINAADLLTFIVSATGEVVHVVDTNLLPLTTSESNIHTRLEECVALLDKVKEYGVRDDVLSTLTDKLLTEL